MCEFMVFRPVRQRREYIQISESMCRQKGSKGYHCLLCQGAFSGQGHIRHRTKKTRMITRAVLDLAEAKRATMEAAGNFPAPFLKWAGGKGSLLPHLLTRVPLHLTDYYEPFLGGGALFLSKCARNTKFHAHLSDINAELINAYRMVKDAPEELISLLSTFQSEYDESSNKSEYYYKKRDWNPTDPIESVARLVFLNKTCYNGLYRVNSQGEFNVPFGRYKNPRILDSENVRAVSRVLRETDAELGSIDYKTALSRCGRGDFIYLDPPYQPVSKTSSFTHYTPSGFSENDQVELAQQFAKLVNRGCTVLLSNSETALTRRLYQDFETRKVTVNRPINSVGTGRRGYKELIVVGVPK